MEQPLVSIIVVSYNHSKYIRENLDSIKAQTYPNIELIVADDASQDNSTEVFDNWLAENNYPAKKNYHSQNTGLATALNECVKMVTGKYVKMIAADDFLHPKSIHKCVEKLEELGEDYGMLFTDTYAINDQSEIMADIADYNRMGTVTPEIFKQNLLIGNQIAALTVLMHTSALKVTGPYNSKYLAEDYYRWLLIAQKYNIGYISEKLAYYRLHSTNISTLQADRIEEENITLKIIFDTAGSQKNKINSYFKDNYFRGKKFTKEIQDLYSKYPGKIKRLSTAISYGVPVTAYRILDRII